MRNAVLAIAGLACIWSVGAPAERAAAMMPATPSALGRAAGAIGTVQEAGIVCDSPRCRREWPERRYWHWGHEPPEEPPWDTSGYSFWGSPEPDLVPADRWARKWHPPYWGWHRRHWHH